MHLLKAKLPRFVFYAALATLLVVTAAWLGFSQGSLTGSADKKDDTYTQDPGVQKIVIFEAGFARDAQKRIIEETGIAVVREIPFLNAWVVRILPEDEEKLLNSPAVKSIEEDVDVYAAPEQEEAEKAGEDEVFFTISAGDEELFTASGSTAISVTRHVTLGRVERGEASKPGSITVLNTGDTPVVLEVAGQNAVGTGPLEGHQLRLVQHEPRGDAQYRAHLKVAGLDKPVVLGRESRAIAINQEENFVLFQGSALKAELEVDVPAGAPAGMYSTSITVTASAAPGVEGDTQVIPWGVERIGAPQAWERSKGEGIKVAVIDTGIDKDHPDLKVAGGYAVSALGGSSDDWDDTHGHGTHVAGIIAGLDNEIGVVGVAPEVELYAIKVMDDSGRGSLSGILEGFQWAIENKMKVINISLTSDKPVPALGECIRAARAAGVLTVAAGGNGGPEEDTLCYPACYEDSIAVVAIDADDAVADLSSRGKELDLVAPGIEVRSTSITGGYENQSGTSMAAAHVTGAIAVLLGSGIPVEAVYYYLTGTASDLGYPDDWQGAGLVRIYVL